MNPPTVSSAPGAASPVDPSQLPWRDEGGAQGGGEGGTVDQARQEARDVVRTGRDEARQLADEARSAVRSRVGDRTGEVAGGLHRTAEELEAMADANPRGEGPIVEATRRLADVAHRTADRLEHEGPEGMLDDVRRFARTRPALFLGAAFGLGIVAGRFLRSDIDQHREDGDGSQGVLDLRDRPDHTYDEPGLTTASDQALPSTSYTTAGAGLVQGGPTQPQDPLAMGGGPVGPQEGRR